MFPIFKNQLTYNMVFPFPASSTSPSIAVNGSTNTQVRRQRDGWWFIGTHITGVAYNYAASGTSIAGTPLLDVPDPSPPAAVGNTWFSTSLITMQFQINNIYDCDVPYTWYGNVGTGKHPLILASPVLVPPNNDCNFVITNNTAVAIAGSLTLKGLLVREDEFSRWVNKQVA